MANSRYETNYNRWLNDELYAVYQKGQKRWAIYRDFNRNNQLGLSLYIKLKKWVDDESLIEEYYNAERRYDDF